MPKSKLRKKLSGQCAPFNKNATPRNKDEDGKPIMGKPHTNPILYTPDNDGHDNPARLRHAATKARHTPPSFREADMNTHEARINYLDNWSQMFLYLTWLVKTRSNVILLPVASNKLEIFNRRYH